MSPSCDYIENLGTGIGRICSALKRANCPEVKPSFTGFFTLEFPRPTYHETSEKILRLTAENRQITIAEMAKTISVTARSIERSIENLKAQGNYNVSALIREAIGKLLNNQSRNLCTGHAYCYFERKEKSLSTRLNTLIQDFSLWSK